MSELQYRNLSEEEVTAELGLCPGWKVTDGRIEKVYDFPTYQQGLVFASHIGFLADQLDHHPDIAIGYKKVVVSVSTHAVNGISPYDFELAKRIDAFKA